MINAYHLSDAMPAALLGMFALWAAASKRHWFIRLAVVATAVLFVLLIPAFEVVVQLGVECLLVVVVLAVWRRRSPSPWLPTTRGVEPTADAAGGSLSARPQSPHETDASSSRRFRLSMQTMLLAVVVVAVATAVAARAPLLPFSTWYHLVADGLVAATVALACVWIVCGRARWRFRLAAAPVLAIVLAVANQACRWALYLANLWYQGTPGTIADYLEATWRNSWPGVTYWIIATSVGMTALCAWLIAMTRAGWFDVFGDQLVEPATEKSRRRTVVARVAAVLLFGLIALFPLALLYQLVAPTPIPDVKLPEPNGFDDFAAAGRMIGPASSKKVSNWDQISESELAAEMAKLAPEFARFREGFKRPCWNPYAFRDWDIQDDEAIIHLFGALRGQVAFARNSGDAKLQLETDLDWLRLSHAIGQGMASLNQNIFYQYETDVQEDIWVRAGSLDAAACTQLAKELWQMDGRRVAWSVVAERQRIIDVNSDWQRRADATLQKWSGIERYPMAKHEYLLRAAQLRMLILKLSVRAFELDFGRLPTSLAELVPKYCAGIPDDPYAAELIKFRPSGTSYVLYCNGTDGDDDGGRENSMRYAADVSDGDITDAELFPALPEAQPAATPTYENPPAKTKP